MVKVKDKIITKTTEKEKVIIKDKVKTINCTKNKY